MALDPNSYPVPQPNQLDGMNPTKAKEQAYYTASLVSPEQMEQTFNTTMDNLVTKGYDQAHANAIEAFQNEQNNDNKATMASLIEDPSIDRATKTRALNDYASGGYISSNIKNKYISNISINDNSTTPLEELAQDERIGNLPSKILKGEAEREADDAHSFLENSGGNLMAAINLIPAVVGGTVDFGFKSYEVYKQMRANGSVTDWQAVANAVGSAEEGVLKSAAQLSITPIAKFFGLDDEMEDSMVQTGLGKVGAGFEWVAEKVAEKQIFGIKTKEQAMFAIEALGFIVPAGFVAKSALKRLGKHAPDTPIAVTIEANPKTGAVLAKEALVDDSGKLSEALGTTKETIIAENMLPDAMKTAGNADDVPVTDVIPDINAQVANATKELTVHENLILETLFDDNIVKKEYRFADLARRINVRNDTRLYYNQASSKINMVDNVLEGKMVFTQGPEYAFTTKGSILNQAEKLQNLANNIAKAEIEEAASAGLGTASQITKSLVDNKIVIRDLKTNQTMSMGEFKKTNFQKGKYQLEYKFRKEYDLLSDSMLGESFANVELPSIFGNKIGTALNNSFIGEYLFGTGFTAKWFERARNDIGAKAGRIQNNITKNFNYLTNHNKKIRTEVAGVIKLQESMGTDYLTRADLQRNFPKLSAKEIDVLDTIQHEWRKTQDSLYEITNMGEKQRLYDSGHDKGIYIGGEYKGAVKVISEENLKKLELEKDFTVYDPDTAKFVKYEAGSNMQVVRMEGKMKMEVKDRENFVSSDYMLVTKNVSVDLLPNRVLNKLPGHTHKEYKSNFFVDVVPKKLTHNGKVLSPAEIMSDFRETRGTATTKFEAEQLREQMVRDLGEDYEVLTLRNADIDNIKDYTAEYRTTTDNYMNARTRAEDMRVLEGDDVLVDPKRAMNNAARSITRTATASQFDKAYKAAFKKDFAKVLDKDINGNTMFPTSLDQISAAGRKGSSVELNKLATEAKALWNRQTHFTRAGEVNALDRAVQSSLHHVADVLEKVINIPGLATIGKESSRLTRKVGNMGATGVSNAAKRVASLAYITFQMPLRHFVIQPMMFYEQSIIFPKTFASTMKKTPIHVLNLLHEGNPLLTRDAPRLVSMMKKADQVEFMKELKAMKAEGILESIDQNLAVSESISGAIKNLDPKSNLLGKAGELISSPVSKVTTVFNKYGFATGELTNRVGLWLQNKERWVADPRNAGKAWDDIRNIKEISFDAWKQSGAMTSSGALQFQRLPVLSFLTQFQSINMKGFMNLIQDNATNLTRADRVKLTANRIAMHGIEFGAPLGAGKFLYDYLSSSDDADLAQIAEEATRGYMDRIANATLSTIAGRETDITLSQSSSIGATNAYADVLGGIWDIGRFISGDTEARSPKIPGVQVMGNIFEKVRNVGHIFKFNPVNAQTLSDSFSEIASITSVGNNTSKAILYLAMDDVMSKNGTKKGLGFGVPESIFQTMGFKTRAEADQWRQVELQRDIETRIKGQVEDFDEQIRANLKRDPENTDTFFRILNLQMSLLEQSGMYSSGQMDKIVKGVIKKQEDRFVSNQTENLMTWALSQDSKSPDIQKFITKFSSHKDPIVRELIDVFKNKKSQQLPEE